MDIREKFTNNLYKYVSNICKNQLSDYEDSNYRVFDVLGVYEDDLRAILKKIVVALPDYIFIRKIKKISSEVLEYLAKEYILFQCQEDITNPYFSDNLINFIYEIINTINKNYNHHSAYFSKG